MSNPNISAVLGFVSKIQKNFIFIQGENIQGTLKRHYKEFSLADSPNNPELNHFRIYDKVQINCSSEGTIQKLILIQQSIPQYPKLYQKPDQNPPPSNPPPSIRNPPPSIRNPPPSIRNPPPQNSNPSPSNSNPPPSNQEIQKPLVNYKSQSISCIKMPMQIMADLLSVRYSHFRYVLNDKNSFYRAFGVALMELIMTPVLNEELYQGVIIEYKNAKACFRPDDRKSANLDLVINFLQREINPWKLNQQLSQCLQNEYFDDGIVSFAKLLTVYSIYKQRNSEQIYYLLFDKQNMQEEFDQVLRLSYVQEKHLIILATGINIELRVVSVENGLKTLTYNQGKRHIIHLLGSYGTYQVLMTRTHYMFLKHSQNIDRYKYHIDNFSLDINSRVETEIKQQQHEIQLLKDTLKTLQQQNSQIKSQNDCFQSCVEISNHLLKDNLNHIVKIEELSNLVQMLKLVGGVDTPSILTLESFVISHTCCYCQRVRQTFQIDCQHIFCQECIIDYTQNKTRGLMIINDFQIENRIVQMPPCPICSKRYNTTPVMQKVLSQKEFKRYFDEAVERESRQNIKKYECKRCRILHIEDNYFTSTHNYQMCKDICQECVIDLIREGQLDCIACGMRYQEPFLKFISEMTLWCKGCRNQKNYFREIGKIQCAQHNKLCIQCLQNIKFTRFCFICSRGIEELEMQEISNFLLKMCSFCYREIRRDDIINFKDCLCSVCIQCQKENPENCIKCNLELNQRVKEHIRNYIQQLIDRQQRHQRDCIICLCSHHIAQTRSLPCNHYFGQQCLAFMISNYVKQNNISMATVCPKDGCHQKISTAIIQDLLSPEDWDKFNWFVINSNTKLVTCPQCHQLFQPWNDRKVRCISCNFEFCKTCMEQYHVQGDCQQIFIERRLKEMEDENGAEAISQCPGCKIPYLKDDHCQHVKCVNQECLVEFCFTCACVRSPTLQHGNHYHRRQCDFYPHDFNPELDPDRMQKDCVMCQKLGQLCAPPKNLAVIRRFGPGEE